MKSPREANSPGATRPNYRICAFMPTDPLPAGAAAGAPRLFALVPCAGAGSRAGADLPKQYSVLAGRAVVGHALRALARLERLTATLVVLSAEDGHFERACPDFHGWVARCGGATRALSVRQGLGELARRGAQAHDWVLVHDAARCLIRPEWINRLIDACIDDPVGGLLAMPLADTLKLEAQGRVKQTVDRAGKWVAQTPQMFRLGLLRQALVNAGPSVTDEASAVEAAGHAPRLVPGSAENFKLTWPEDFDIAARLLGSAPRDHDGIEPAAPEASR
jgi:2-C-methyl-D-erythritol 4-phosphate cytidylyltransferase